jgi:hypothetical protein
MISASIDSLFSGLIWHLLEPAIRSIGLACLVAVALTPFRKKSTALRLSVWTGVLYAALAMPLLSRLLPPIPLPQGVFSERQFAPAALESRFNLFAEHLPAMVADNGTSQAAPKAHTQAPVGTSVSWLTVAAMIYLPITGILLAAGFVDEPEAAAGFPSHH